MENSPAYSLSNITLPSTCRRVTKQRNKPENNMLKVYFSVASFISVNYKPPFNYQLHKTCHSICPLWTWKTVTWTNSMWTAVGVYKTSMSVTRTLREGMRVRITAAQSLCKIKEFQNTQAYFTLHLMVTTPDSSKSYASTACRMLKQKLFCCQYVLVT